MIPGRSFIAVIVLALLAAPSSAVEIAGVDMPGALKAGGSVLVLNGGGKRTMYGIKVYAAALYLKKNRSDPDAVINADEPMAVRLKITSGLITPGRMKREMEEGFRKSTGGNMPRLKVRMDALTACFRELTRDDVYDLVYLPGKGVEVSRDGRLVTIIRGLDFKKGLFGVWLSGEPVQKDLKEGMLGR